MYHNNVKKVFDLLGIEPNEKFKVSGTECDNLVSFIFTIDENLIIKDEKGNVHNSLSMVSLLRGDYKIIKLPKENKKKLRDLTMEEYKKWVRKNCSNLSCEDCVFLKAKCNTNSIGCWINHKDAYSEKFLNQEIEVENNA